MRAIYAAGRLIFERRTGAMRTILLCGSHAEVSASDTSHSDLAVITNTLGRMVLRDRPKTTLREAAVRAVDEVPVSERTLS